MMNSWFDVDADAKSKVNYQYERTLKIRGWSKLTEIYGFIFLLF